MDEWIKEMKRILADLLQCGFSSVRQETLDRLKEMAGIAARLGLHEAEKNFREIHQALSLERHRVLHGESAVMDRVCELNESLKLCMRRMDYESACEFYKAANGGRENET